MTSLLRSDVWQRCLLWLRRVSWTISLGGRVVWVQSIFRRLFKHASSRVRIVDFDGVAELSLDLSEHMQRRIFWMGYYNSEIVELLNKLLLPGMVVIDVGANVGEISIVAAHRVGPSGAVVAFEPLASVAESLENSVRINGLSSLRVIRAGLADMTGEFPIYSSCGQGEGGELNGGLASLYGDPERDPVIQYISVTTLDGYLERAPLSRIDVIKIDIEGAELPCLLGAIATLSKFKPILIIEIQRCSANAAGYLPTDIFGFLKPLGYDFFRIGKGGRLAPLGAEQLLDYQNVACIIQTGASSQ